MTKSDSALSYGVSDLKIAPLWSILFSLGVFASCRLLPRPVVGVAVYYLLSGALCLIFFREDLALSPWVMAVTFGIGQLLAATILYVTLERRHGEV